MIIGGWASENLDIYKQEVNSLKNYNLKKPSHIYNMFIIEKSVQKKVKRKKIQKKIKLKSKNIIQLIAILNNQVLLKIDNKTKWFKVGQKIGDYKIIKILNENAIVILDNKKMRILSLKENKNFKIKVR